MEAFSGSDPISAKTHKERKRSTYQINFWLAILPYKFSIIPILIPSNCVVTQINPMQLMKFNTFHTLSYQCVQMKGSFPVDYGI